MILFKQLTLRKPLQWNVVEGTYNFAIIAYSRRPYLMKLRHLDVPSGDGITTLRVPEDFVAQYEKYLIVDLWLAIIRLHWLTREKS